jgi:hypothetical protein
MATLTSTRVVVVTRRRATWNLSTPRGPPQKDRRVEFDVKRMTDVRQNGRL